MRIPWLTPSAGLMREHSSSVPALPGVQSTDLLSGIPTQAHADEIRAVVAGRYSDSSRSSIEAARVHWGRVRSEWGWAELIETGDPRRGAKLSCYVLALMAYEREPGLYYPSSTITNYVWALCAFMQQNLCADPRANVVGWAFFMASVNVMCYVPYEPRRRVPTSCIRHALAAVDSSSFDMVQMAVLVLFLYFTFQRSEFPCPKTYDGMDPAKHLYVKHMEPYHGGFRWAVGATKADPRAERLSADAGPGREWIVVGEVNNDLFDLRVWLQRLFSFYPEGPRDPDSPFFRCTRDLTRPYLYRDALADFRLFLTGHVDDPALYGLHGIRSEAFNVCSHAVGEEAAVIQGGWKGVSSASRYDRLTPEVVSAMGSRHGQGPPGGVRGFLELSSFWSNRRTIHGRTGELTQSYLHLLFTYSTYTVCVHPSGADKHPVRAPTATLHISSSQSAAICKRSCGHGPQR